MNTPNLIFFSLGAVLGSALTNYHHTKPVPVVVPKRPEPVEEKLKHPEFVKKFTCLSTDTDSTSKPSTFTFGPLFNNSNVVYTNCWNNCGHAEYLTTSKNHKDEMIAALYKYRIPHKLSIAGFFFTPETHFVENETYNILADIDVDTEVPLDQVAARLKNNYFGKLYAKKNPKYIHWEGVFYRIQVRQWVCNKNALEMFERIVETTNG